MNKRMDGESSLRSVIAFLEAGLTKVSVGYIPGFPGDTRERFIRTATILRELQDKYPAALAINAEPFVVTPNQTIAKDLASVGLVGHTWTDEVLALAPAYRDLTEKIWCTVSGSNQGLERVGQSRIAATLAADADRSFSSDPSTYAYWENLRDRHFVFRHVFGDWWLARYITSASVINAFLVTTKERNTDGTAAINAARHTESDTICSSIADKWRRKHLVCPIELSLPGVFTQVTEMPQSGSLAMSPFCVCRDIDEPQLSLLLVDHHTGIYTRLERSMAPLLRRLAAGPVPIAELEAEPPPANVTPAQLAELYKKWLRSGLIVAMGRSQELRPPPRPTSVRNDDLIRLGRRDLGL
jgi:hypothetical protein